MMLTFCLSDVFALWLAETDQPGYIVGDKFLKKQNENKVPILNQLLPNQKP